MSNNERIFEIDQKHRLSEEKEGFLFHRSTRNTTKGFRGKIKPELIVLHWTGGPRLLPALNTFMNPKSGVSAHVLIDRDGTVYQLANFDRKTWHAGKSSHKGRLSVNNFSIGIELVNAGPLNRVSGGRFLTKMSGIEIPKSQVTAKNNGYYQRYSEEQLKALCGVVRALSAKYGISECVGHSDVSPGRKIDPGPLLSPSKVLGASSTSLSIPSVKRLFVMPIWLRNLMSVFSPTEPR